MLPSGSVLRELDFRRRHERRADVGFGGSPFIEHQQHARPALERHEPALVVQREQQAPPQAHERAAPRRATTQDQTTNLLGTFTLQFARRSRGRPPASFYARSSSPRIAARQRSSSAACRSATRTAARATCRSSTACGSTATTSSPAPTYNSDVERLFGARNDDVPNRAVREPARRLLVDVRHGAADRRIRRRGARPARRGARRHRRLPEHAERAALIGYALDNTGLPSARAAVTCVGAAAPTPDWDAYARDPAQHPDAAAPTARTGTVFASTRAERHAVRRRTMRRRAALRSQPPVERPDARQPLHARPSTATYSLQPQPVGHRRPQLQADAAVHARRRRRPAGVRAADEHRAGDRRDRVARRARRASVHARQRAALRPAVARAGSSRSASAPTAFSTTFSWSCAYIVLATCASSTAASRARPAIRCDVAWGRSRVRLAPPDHLQPRLQLLRRRARELVRPVPLGHAVHADDRRRHQRRRLRQRPRVRLRSRDDRRSGARRRRCGRCSPTDRRRRASACRAARHARRRATAARGRGRRRANLNITFNPLKVRMPQRATLSFQLSNPLGAADLLLHGENRLHGWGQSAVPRLSRCCTCAASTRRRSATRYEVNQRFGSTQPAVQRASARRSRSRRSLRFDVGPTRERQTLTQTARSRPHAHGDQAMPERHPQAHVRHRRRHEPDGADPPPEDTLELTGAQADSIATLNRWYTIRLDSIWIAVAKRAGARCPTRYDQGEAYDRYTRAREATVDLLIGARPAHQRAPHRRAAPQAAPRSSRATSTALSRRHPQRHRGTAGGPSFSPGVRRRWRPDHHSRTMTFTSSDHS